jgi:hypothetical protein
MSSASSSARAEGAEVPLERDEFQSAIELVLKSVEAGFDGVHRRQDVTNGRITASEDRINGLSERLVKVEESRTSLATIAATAGGIGVAIGGLLTWLAK